MDTPAAKRLHGICFAFVVLFCFLHIDVILDVIIIAMMCVYVLCKTYASVKNSNEEKTFNAKIHRAYSIILMKVEYILIKTEYTDNITIMSY